MVQHVQRSSMFVSRLLGVRAPPLPLPSPARGEGELGRCALNDWGGA